MSMEGIVENQGKLGKLKLVGKVRGAFVCADCKKDFPVGSSCYDQSDYRGAGFFPEKIRVCFDCGEIKRKGGTEVKPKPEPKKKKVVVEEKQIFIDPRNGCGKDTDYPKPNSSGVWRCGEKAPVIGIMKCKECGGLK